jgi:hypothetical protein
MGNKNQNFDPDWRDDVFDPAALEIPLVFPSDSSPDGGIWVQSRIEGDEFVFGKAHRHSSPRVVKAIIKKSDLIDYHTFSDQAGNPMPKSHPIYDVLFPPKAWMSDSAEERCMTFAAAKLARGKILVGGLGLAVYPQLVLQLNRPLDAMTIVESDSRVIELLGNAWMSKLSGEPASRIRIIQGTIESYLQETAESFDTIYLDTWEDSDPRFLPYANYLVQLALLKCAPNGQIQCWSYALMLDTFVRDAVMYAQNKFPLQNFHLDPALEKFSEWLQSHRETSLSQETVAAAAREIALTTAKSLEDYDRNRCFTPYAISMSEAVRNMARSRKP